MKYAKYVKALAMILASALLLTACTNGGPEDGDKASSANKIADYTTYQVTTAEVSLPVFHEYSRRIRAEFYRRNLQSAS